MPYTARSDETIDRSHALNSDAYPFRLSRFILLETPSQAPKACGLIFGINQHQ